MMSSCNSSPSSSLLKKEKIILIDSSSSGEKAKPKKKELPIATLNLSGYNSSRINTEEVLDNLQEKVEIK
jgi:hypothetical protein